MRNSYINAIDQSVTPYSTQLSRSSPPTPFIADTGANENFLTPAAPCSRKLNTTSDIRAIMPDGGTIQATYRAHLPFPQLPSAASTNHVFPHLRNSLVSIGQICDQDYVALFDKHKMQIYEKDTIQPLLTTRKIPSKQYEPAPAPADKQQRYEVNSVYHQENLKDLVTFLHAAGSPTPSTWIPTIKKGFYAHGPDSTCQQTFTTIRSHHQRSPRPTKTEHPFHQSTNAIDC